MSDSPAEVLFLRVPPRGLVEPVAKNPAFDPSAGLVRRVAPVRARALHAGGLRGFIGPLPVTCFWIGLGRRVRTPGPELVERLRDGTMAEIVDIGCAGALDPALRRGDLVLSTGDLAFDVRASMPVQRRPEPAVLAESTASRRGVAFHRGPILTHEHAVASRSERLRLFESTGCVAVQMEHVWFLQLLRSLLPGASFGVLRVTHLVLITDAVPHTDGRWATARAAWEALRGYALPGGKRGIASLRRDLLSRWPQSASGGEAGPGGERPVQGA